MTRPTQLAAVSASYDQTAAEISAGVTPTNYGYPPGNVKRYGATGDGTTNDTAAFTAAFASSYSVFVPAGTYSVSAINIPPGCSMIGAGISATTIKARSAVNLVNVITPLPVTLGNRYGQVSDFTIDGNSLAPVGLLINVAVFRYFKSLHFINCTEGLVVAGCQNSIFEDIHINGGATSLVVNNGADNNIFIRIELESFTTTGLRIENTNTTYGSNLSGIPYNNTFERSIIEFSLGGSYGLTINGGTNFCFEDCDLGLGFTGSRRVVYISSGARHKFINCTFNGAGTTDTFVEIATAVTSTFFTRPSFAGQTAGAVAISTGSAILVRDPDFNGDAYTVSNTAGDSDYNLDVKYGVRAIGSATDPTSTANKYPGQFFFGNNQELFFNDKSGFYQLYSAATLRGSVATANATSHNTTVQLASQGQYLLMVRTQNGDGNHSRTALYQIGWITASVNNLNVAVEIGSDMVTGTVMTALTVSVSTTGLVTIADTASASTAGVINYKFTRMSY